MFGSHDTVEPPLSGHPLLSSQYSCNQSPKIIVEKNGKLNL